VLYHWLTDLIPYQLWRWIPVGSGIGVGCLVLFTGALCFSHWKRIPLRDVILLRRRKPSAPPPNSSDQPVQLAPVYLPTPDEDIFYLRKGRERRRWVRRWGNPVEVRITSPLHPETLSGTVVNRSTGGVALLVDHAFDAGAILKVRAVLAPKNVPCLDVEVKNCRKAGRNWVVGCEYPENPPWNALVWLD
jgi:hypothetical protein